LIIVLSVCFELSKWGINNSVTITQQYWF